MLNIVTEKYKNISNINKAYLYYWLYALLLSLNFAFIIDTDTLLEFISRGWIIVEIVFFYILQFIFGLFNFEKIEKIQDIEKEISKYLFIFSYFILVHILSFVLGNYILPNNFEVIVKKITFYALLLIFLFFINKALKISYIGAIARYIDDQKQAINKL